MASGQYQILIGVLIFVCAYGNKEGVGNQIFLGIRFAGTDFFRHSSRTSTTLLKIPKE
jgi:hypothetical protein